MLCEEVAALRRMAKPHQAAPSRRRRGPLEGVASRRVLGTVTFQNICPRGIHLCQAASAGSAAFPQGLLSLPAQQDPRR
jgi:hypothetical protein